MNALVRQARPAVGKLPGASRRQTVSCGGKAASALLPNFGAAVSRKAHPANDYPTKEEAAAQHPFFGFYSYIYLSNTRHILSIYLISYDIRTHTCSSLASDHPLSPAAAASRPHRITPKLWWKGKALFSFINSHLPSSNTTAAQRPIRWVSGLSHTPDNTPRVTRAPVSSVVRRLCARVLLAGCIRPSPGSRIKKVPALRRGDERSLPSLRNKTTFFAIYGCLQQCPLASRPACLSTARFEPAPQKV